MGNIENKLIQFLIDLRSVKFEIDWLYLTSTNFHFEWTLSPFPFWLVNFEIDWIPFLTPTYISLYVVIFSSIGLSNVGRSHYFWHNWVSFQARTSRFCMDLDLDNA